MPVFQNFKYIPAFPVREFRQAPVINDEHGVFCNA